MKAKYLLTPFLVLSLCITLGHLAALPDSPRAKETKKDSPKKKVRGAAVTLTSTTATVPSGTVGQHFGLQVTVKDSTGNPVGEGTVSATLADAAGNAVPIVQAPRCMTSAGLMCLTNGPVAGGTATLAYSFAPDLKPGVYTATVSYSTPTGNFAPAQATTTVTVTDASAFYPPAVTTPYQVVAVSQPRDINGLVERQNSEIFFPNHGSPSDIVLIDTNAKTETTLVSGVAQGDFLKRPVFSFDGTRFWYTRVYKGGGAGSDICRYDFATGKETVIPGPKYFPNKAADDAAKVWTYHMDPVPFIDGLTGKLRLLFVTNYKNHSPPLTGSTSAMFQLAVMDEDGSNFQKIGHLNLGCAIDPVIDLDGTVIFSSFESQGQRQREQWSAWRINADGVNWLPFKFRSNPFGDHNITPVAKPKGGWVVEGYYQANDCSAGVLNYIPPPPADVPPFTSAYLTGTDDGKTVGKFWPVGTINLVPFTEITDIPAPNSVKNDVNSPRVGKYAFPTAAPGGDLLCSWTPGPVNHDNILHLPTASYQVVLIPGTNPITAPNQAKGVWANPKNNYLYPVAKSAFQDVFGQPAPAPSQILPNDGTVHPALPAGTPYGLIGTSSMTQRSSYPNGLVQSGSVAASANPGDLKRPTLGLPRYFEDALNSNAVFQGYECRIYSQNEICFVRVLGLQPSGVWTANRAWQNQWAERCYVIGEYPVQKWTGGQPAMDPNGQRDTSFLAKIPADEPFTFQTLDKTGKVLNMAQTWHMVKAGELKANCNGCHAHDQLGLVFEVSLADKPDYVPFDGTDGQNVIIGCEKALDVSGKQWIDDDSVGYRKVPTTDRRVRPTWNGAIKPILAQFCTSCHSPQNAGGPAGNLDLSDATPTKAALSAVGVPFTTDRAYFTLCSNLNGQYGGTKLAQSSYTLMSRYLARCNSSRSLFCWKRYGKNEDGFGDGYFPVETTWGDATTYPGTFTFAKILQSGLTFTTTTQAQTAQWAGIPWSGKKCPPDGSPQPSDDDWRTIYTWIDTGCATDTGTGDVFGSDNIEPTLAVTSPRRGAQTTPVTQFVVGLADNGSGLNMPTFSVTTDFTVDGQAAGTNLAGKFTKQGDALVYALATPLANQTGSVTYYVEDNAGNRSRQTVTFSVAAPTPVATTTTATVTPNTIVSAPNTTVVTISGTIKDQNGNPVNEGTAWMTISAADIAVSTQTAHLPVVNGQVSGTVTVNASPKVQTWNAWCFFLGTANFAASRGNAPFIVTAPVVLPTVTTLTVAAAQATSNPTDQTVTLSATLTPNTVNEGSVTFSVLNGTTVVGTGVVGTVTGGTATAPYTLPGGTAAGTLTIQASYADVPGGTAYAASSGTGTLTVNPAPNPNAAEITFLQARAAALQAVLNDINAEIVTLQNPQMTTRKKVGASGKVIHAPIGQHDPAKRKRITPKK